MTIETSVSRVSYSGNGTTANYEYSFKAFAASDLTVFIITDATSAVTTLTINTDYTVNGVGNTSGGSIDLIDASQAWIDASSFLDSGYTLVIRRVVSVKQLTDVRNLGAFSPQIHEDAFDYLTAIDQQQEDELARTVQFEEAVDPADFNGEIPAAVVGSAGTTIITNPSGNGWVVGPTASEISGASANASAAAASAAAASTSETNAATSETNAAASESAAAASADSAAAAAAAALNEVSTVESISGSGEIAHSGEVRQYRPVQGNGGAVTTSNTPFGTTTTNFTNGMEITLIGRDDTNSVTIPVVNTAWGIKSPNGTAILQDGFSVTYVCDTVEQRFIEKCRNH